MKFIFNILILIFCATIGCSTNRINEQKLMPKNLYFQAISRCDIQEFENIRQQNNFSYNEQSDSKATPIMIAAYRGKEPCVKYLLDKNVDLNSREESLRSVIFYAIEGKNEKILSLILESKGVSKEDLNLPDKFNLTPIMTSAFLGLERATRDLHLHGSDLNKVDENGWNSLFFAVSSGNIEVVRFLINNGAKFNYKDKDGLSPMDIAKEDGNREVFEFLSNELKKESQK